MKLRKPLPQTVLGVLLLIMAILMPPPRAWALTPRARERECIIQSIDLERHALTLRCGKDAETLELVWIQRTKFLKNWKFSDAASLKEGQAVVVYYHSPFFGKKFAIKVVWQNGLTCIHLPGCIPGKKKHEQINK
jgi:hypothetical protein